MPEPSSDLFSDVAPAYAACRPGYPKELFAYLAALVSRRELAWDCAAGSGQATMPLADIFQRVVATDISAPMLDQAPRHPRVEYRVASAESSGLGPGTVDLITVAQALHWLDTGAFYAVAERVMAPAGVLAVWTYGAQYLGIPAIDRLLQRFYTDTVGPYWPPERAHVESGYRTLAFPFRELEAPEFTMEASWTLAQLLGYIGTWSASQRYRASRGVDPVAQFALELEPQWGGSATSYRVRWPLSLRVGFPSRPPAC